MFSQRAAAEILVTLGFEKLICPMVLPKSKGAMDELYYGASVVLTNGGELYVRSKAGPFNLLPKKAIKNGVRKVFSIGPGLADGKEFEDLVQAQWFDAPHQGEAEICAHFTDLDLSWCVNEHCGKRNITFAFLCGAQNEC
ncbi:hypothetical protein CFBP5877_27745 (plasmid) [Agrobacterium tumefaciens]|uniref:Uncharacterized protein n=1 Tax=Agrobacterium tumefaciens TaxID=358 RepID=A0AAE6BJ51_AGRTU|nr:hypothetical protein [Agrobacterium tumefaciens]QCL82906.1 hypothetical protein CFBP5877_27745 [Agrobacterium tumefaciens]